MKEKGLTALCYSAPHSYCSPVWCKSPMSDDYLVHAGFLGTQVFPGGCLEPVATAQGTSVRLLWGCRAVKPLT